MICSRWDEVMSEFCPRLAVLALLTLLANRSCLRDGVFRLSIDWTHSELMLLGAHNLGQELL